MRLSVFGLGTFGVALPALLAVYSCGGSSAQSQFLKRATRRLLGVPMDGGAGVDATNPFQFTDAGDASFDTTPPQPFMDAGFVAPDCRAAPSLRSARRRARWPPRDPGRLSTDNVLVPPNMNVISVHWTPFSAQFLEFEVDFENSVTDMRVITKCAAQTMDTEQPSVASGGCELQLDSNMWAFISNQNRGRRPCPHHRPARPTACARPVDKRHPLAFAEEDLLGALYYWKSTVSRTAPAGRSG